MVDQANMTGLIHQHMSDVLVHEMLLWRHEPLILRYKDKCLFFSVESAEHVLTYFLQVLLCVACYQTWGGTQLSLPHRVIEEIFHCDMWSFLQVGNYFYLICFMCKSYFLPLQIALMLMPFLHCSKIEDVYHKTSTSIIMGCIYSVS